MANTPFPYESMFQNEGRIRLSLITAWRQLRIWLTSRRGVDLMSKTTGQTITSGTDTALTSWVASTHKFGVFDDSSGVFTFTEGGAFLLFASVAFVANSVGDRGLYLASAPTGGVFYARQRVTATSGSVPILSLAVPVVVQQGDGVAVRAYQSTGAGLDVATASLRIARLSI